MGLLCSSAGCKAPSEFLSNCSYVSSHGTAAHTKRTFCAEHARGFAMRNTLAWPPQEGKVRIRFDFERARAA